MSEHKKGEPRAEILSEARRAILKWIDQYHEEHGHSPSERDIADGLGLTQPPVRHHLRRLRRAGLIGLKRKTPRSVVVTELGRSILRELSAARSISEENSADPSARSRREENQ